ncbi:MAG: Rieske (2Fe-2S) protein [Dehalococcoidia bacterium]|nr:Rieske (2Fe-2S) protein [Dehalococcoidia bacterium]MSQ17627.1 Rieske (2Fe-2S) protein [Dehalococcoidia bacterium]
MTDLGLESAFTKFPAMLTLSAESFFLVKGKKGGYQLLSAICPHSHGDIRKADNCFTCPSHGWHFSLDNGECINGPLARMYSAPVVVKNGHLVVEGELP